MMANYGATYIVYKQEQQLPVLYLEVNQKLGAIYNIEQQQNSNPPKCFIKNKQIM